MLSPLPIPLKATASVLLLLGWLGFQSSVLAQDVPPLEEIRRDYNTVELTRGWLLQPKSEQFDRMEIVDGEILVDGTSIDEAELRRLVGDEHAGWLILMADGVQPGPARPAEPPEPPEEPEPVADESTEGSEAKPKRRAKRRTQRDTHVSVGSSLVIEENEVYREVVLMSGRLQVDGEVDGDATVVLGSAHVTGKIDGSLVVVGGSVYLDSTAFVDGEVVSVGGLVRREPGAEVDGEITQVGLGDSIEVGDLSLDFGWPGALWPDSDAFDFSLFDLVGRAIGLGFLGLILYMILFLAPQKVESIGRRVRLELWKSALVGLLVELLFLPMMALVCVLLLISLVGIPLLIFILPLMVVAMLFFLILGFAGICLQTGEVVADRFGRQNLGAYLALGLGLVFLYIWSLIGDALSFAPFPAGIVAVLFLMFGFCVKYIAWTLGLGAAVLDQLAPLPAGASIAGDDRWNGTPSQDAPPGLSSVDEEIDRALSDAPPPPKL